jgi:hypothetical protein
MKTAAAEGVAKREFDCDCPCDTCAIGTGIHCGEFPCDVTNQNEDSEAATHV